jgi:ribonuclease III
MAGPGSPPAPLSRSAPAELEAQIGHAFHRPELLVQALTHPSYAHEHPPASHNEALAFLGDAVVGLVVAELLLVRSPSDGAGPLTQRRASLVSAPSLAAWGAWLGLPAHLHLGRGEEQGGGRGKESILATAFEAVVGALYLDGGLAPTARLLGRLVDRG